ncbi:MAG TPA: gliding motility-associated C-terminal domain-containing protein, partial [Saprospiraceae bacterium]|nr:gliding motility-associated C-terminal domain-containing protein [Saprospiraceae bacterium]
KNWLGCDSIVSVTVSELPSSSSALTLHACPGGSATYAGTALPAGSTQAFTLKNWLGCDSIVSVTVSELPVTSTVLNVEVCPEADYLYQGVVMKPGETRKFVLKIYTDCDSTVTVNVSAWSVPTYEIATEKSCAGTANGSLRVENTAGSNLPLEFSLQGAAFQSTPIFESLQAGLYTLRMRDNKGCLFEQDAEIQGYAPLQVSLENAVLACDAASVRLEPTLSGDLTGLMFAWSDGGSAPWTDATLPGKVWVEVSNVCETLRRESVVYWEAYEADTSLCYVPNVFSPHAGRQEDRIFRPLFSPKLTMLDYRLEVYDRWGNLVFLSLHAESGWEAEANGRADDAPGVYTWLLRARAAVCGRELTLYRQGDVTVMR